ncbi:MAG TPA: preprotein translocase subunit SecE [Phycisphaerales bacterium]|nr:preprotein translocase subunit SecE [Phycisphaerales bacterium]
MNLGIYKSGQGYWVRVMTAVLLGLVTAAFAAWFYGQMQVLADRLPKAGYRIGFETEQPGAFAVGDAVELTTRPDAGGTATTVGTAVVSNVDPGEKKLVTIKDFAPAPAAPGAAPFIPSAAAVIRKTGPAPRSVNIAKNSVVGIPPVDPTILAGSGAALVVIVASILGYWLIGLRPRTVEFLIATDFEMKKVNWSTPREVIGHTWVVIGACFLLATALWFVDQALRFTFTAIGLLPPL